MKEIKFRAVRFFKDGTCDMDYSKHWKSLGEFISFLEVNYQNNHKLLAYTGLKDKNGTEIYEGDIVIAWSAGVKAICEVKWGQGRAGFFLYRKPNIAWNLSGGGKDYNEENVEVIGNIYEHPHLLGGEEE